MCMIEGLENVLGTSDEHSIHEKSSILSTSSTSRSSRNFFDFGGVSKSQRLNGPSQMSQGGINLSNVSYLDVSADLNKGEPEQDLIAVGEKMVPLNQVFYITDMVVINNALAGKLIKCSLEESSIMVRSSKDKLYDSSE